MESENQFWLGLWKIVGSVVTTIVITIAIYSYMHNIQYYKSWNMCIEVGGQPTDQTMLGSNDKTFTCVRK